MTIGSGQWIIGQGIGHGSLINNQYPNYRAEMMKPA